MAYRITVTDATTVKPDLITFPCTIEKQIAPGVWSPVENAPSSVQIPTDTIANILLKDLTDDDKRTQILTQFKFAVAALPILRQDACVDEIESLLPSGWPVTTSIP